MSLFSSLVKQQKVISLPKSATISEASQEMSSNKVGSIIVLDGEKLVGIFTERDLLNRVVSKGRNPVEVSLHEVMSTDPCTISINETAENGFKKMQETKCRRLPIMDGDKVVGMVTMRNILEWIMKEIEEENIQLKKYIQS